jgi:hypothetical protein
MEEFMSRVRGSVNVSGAEVFPFVIGGEACAMLTMECPVKSVRTTEDEDEEVDAGKGTPRSR